MGDGKAWNKAATYPEKCGEREREEQLGPKSTLLSLYLAFLVITQPDKAKGVERY